MGIKYNAGNQIVHIYKGFEITKISHYYSQGTETFYKITKKPDYLTETEKMTIITSFERLKDAKQYIDNYNTLPQG